MNINQLKYFQAACQLNNITKAAEKLHISQPSISNAIKDLECELGVCLLNRDRKKISITATGKYFFDRISKILHEIDSLSDQIKEYDEDSKYDISVGISECSAPSFFRLLPSINEHHSNMKLRTYEGSVDNIADSINNGDLDFGLVILNDSIRQSYNYSLLDESRIYYCVNNEGSYSKRSKVRFDEVCNMPLAWFSSEPVISGILQNEYSKLNCKPEKVITTTRISVMLDLLSYDKNVGAFMLRDAVANSPAIKAIPLSNALNVEIGLIWDKNREIAGFKKFHEMIGQCCNS